MNESKPAISAKQSLRQLARRRRRQQPDPEAASKHAVEKVLSLQQYKNADVAMWYVHCRNELQTQAHLPAAIQTDKKIVVPFCTVDDNGHNTLGLWHLKKLSELESGKWNILEPPAATRQNHPEQIVDPSELDIVLVPGVAFDKNGGRLGNGQGYYDRFFVNARAGCHRVGICYECQIFDNVRLQSHDVSMDQVITEQNIYPGNPRNAPKTDRL